MTKSERKIHKILIMKPGAIGDLLQLSPVIRALKNRFPETTISLIVGSSVTADLFKYNPFVHETIVFDRKGTHKSFVSILKLWQRLRRNRYDLILNFQRSNLKTWLLASASFPCSVLVYHKARQRHVHAVTNYLETLAPLGIGCSDTDLELTPGPDDKAFAHKLLAALERKKGPLIALNPGASHEVNRWSMDHFAALADLLASKLYAQVILIGGNEDAALADKIASRTNSKPFIIAGKTSLLQLAAILEQCDVLVSGDTGPMHLATAVKTKVIALFGAADPDRTGPVGSGHRVIQAEGLKCVPCRKRTCNNNKYRECMERIPVNPVFKAIQEILD